MIVPMKKVSILIMDRKKEETLKILRKLGLVHIEISESSSPKIPALQKQISLLENALYVLEEIKSKDIQKREANKDESLQLAEKIMGLLDEKKAYETEQMTVSAELERLAGWGEINPEAFAELEEKDIYLSLYELPLADYQALPEEVLTLAFEKTKYAVKCMAMVRKKDDLALLLPLSAYLVPLPQKSTATLKSIFSQLTEKLKQLEAELASLTAYCDAMKQAIPVLQKEIQFETYATGMTDECLSPEGNGNFTVSHFVGFIEAEHIDVLKTAAKENAWGLLVEDPTEEDNAPTKLKNNKFVSLIYPLTDFLGTVPGYFEYDISAWFLGFILVFFGIIFGDGAYGLLITAIAAVPIIKCLLAKKSVPPAFLLIGLFGLSTIAWGTLTCTWFGLSAERLPRWLQKLSIPVISNVYADKIWYPFWTNGTAGLTTSQNVQIFCFTLALIQLSVAHIKGAVRNRKSLKMLGDIGSVLELFGIYYVVLSLVVNSAVFGLGLTIGGFPVGLFAVALVGVGFVMSFVFSNYEGKIGASVLASLKDIVSVLLGVINVFSDIVSYIRLWAVGLAGAAISSTVNELVSPFLGNFLFIIIAIVLLVFGHGLNMILNVLSVIVHGIRLNTLEFSSHLNMSWSGHKYEPFKE